MGIQEIAEINEYDILLCICQENDITGLRRIIQNRKVDGVVLLRTFVDDPQIEFLIEKNIPFVAAGTSQNKKVKQIDHDHENACRELTSIILMKGMKKIAILGGNEHIFANQKRMKGVKAAYSQYGKELDEQNLYMNLDGEAVIEKTVENVQTVYFVWMIQSVVRYLEN